MSLHCFPEKSDLGLHCLPRDLFALKLLNKRYIVFDCISLSK